MVTIANKMFESECGCVPMLHWIKRGRSERTQAGLSSFLPRVSLIFLVLMLGGTWSNGDGWGATSSLTPQTNLQVGRITSIERDALLITSVAGTQLAISARRYALSPKVTITEENGRLRDQTFLKAGGWIKFHLKREPIDQIDQIVLIQPR